jgi:hypothetical protein
MSIVYCALSGHYKILDCYGNIVDRCDSIQIALWKFPNATIEVF